MDLIEEKLRNIFEYQPRKIVISKPKVKTKYYKIVFEHNRNQYNITNHTKFQTFHDNLTCAEAFSYCLSILGEVFLQLNAWDGNSEHILLLSKNGAVTHRNVRIKNMNIPKVTENHNKTKKYIILEGMAVAPLVDMGVFSTDGKIISSMYNKYRQINRFIEQVDDAVKNISELQHINIIDFGCGKSYLTFILYHYFVEIKKISVNILGLDLKESVILKCNEAAKKYGYSNLRFIKGDINGFQAPFDVDMIITLHACDVATDYALYNAIVWNAKIIFSVPCCQHELNSQIKPKTLSILSNYGIVKERFSALATDAIRGNILEYFGYKTQLLEFIDFEGTPKNILIRAVKKKNVKEALRNKKMFEIVQLIAEFGFYPKLYKLLFVNK